MTPFIYHSLLLLNVGKTFPLTMTRTLIMTFNMNIYRGSSAFYVKLFKIIFGNWLLRIGIFFFFFISKHIKWLSQDGLTVFWKRGEKQSFVLLEDR